MLKKLAGYKIIRFFTSFRLAVVCLLFLIILTFWGTLHQIEHGLYVTQSMMFNSWFFLTLGFIPFPGARLVLWVALINIVSVTIFRFQYKWNKLGIWLIHLGLILLIVSGGVTLHFAQESSLMLDEGQGSNTSSDYHHWELAFWTQSSQGDSLLKDVEAFNLSDMKSGQIIENTGLGIRATIDEFFPNARAFRGSNLLPSDKFINSSSIAKIEQAETHGDPAENIPGIILKLESTESKDSTGMNMLLFGGEINPTSVNLNDKRIYCLLRRKQYMLPLTLKLIDFIKKDHLQMSMAKSFESRVVIDRNGFQRELVISMNQPLRVDNFTFYQASFAQSNMGESSTLAIVENPGRILPYVSSIIVGLGLIIHFLMMLFRSISRNKRKLKSGSPA